MSASQATHKPTYGQAFRHSGVIVNTSTGNPITGGLTTLTGSVSIDGGAFTSTGVTATEIGTTGYFTMDVDATRMTGNTIIFKATAANASAREWSDIKRTADLRESAGHWLDQTTVRWEQGIVLVSAFLTNYHTITSSLESVKNRGNSLTIVSGVVGGLASPSVVTRQTMS